MITEALLATLLLTGVPDSEHERETEAVQVLNHLILGDELGVIDVPGGGTQPRFSVTKVWACVERGSYDPDDPSNGWEPGLFAEDDPVTTFTCFAFGFDDAGQLSGGERPCQHMFTVGLAVHWERPRSLSVIDGWAVWSPVASVDRLGDADIDGARC